MQTLSFELNGSTAKIGISGRVDSQNAAAIEDEINEYLGKTAHTEVAVDFDGLEYISSAGLRVLLRLRKSETGLTVINASAEVFETLDMTGFTDMLPVKKAYRKISVDGCTKIGKGATGEVYRIDDDIIAKVYFEGYALPEIHRERELARKAFVLGIPTAIPYDVVKVGERYGSVFELLKAKSMAELIRTDANEVDRCIDLSVELMKKLHSTAVNEGDLPSAKNTALKNAAYLKTRLPRELAEKFGSMVDEIPESLNMVHGDLHIKNMMLQNGELMLIDMDTLSCGHPIFELCAMFEAYCGYSEIDKENTFRFFGIKHEIAEYIWRETLIRYFGTNDGGRLEEIENKIKLMSYASLYRYFTDTDEPLDENAEACVKAYMRHITELLNKVNSFVF